MQKTHTFKLLRDISIIDAHVPSDLEGIVKLLIDPPFKEIKAGTTVTVFPTRNFLINGYTTVSLQITVEGEESSGTWGVKEDDFESCSGISFQELDLPEVEKVDLPPVKSIQEWMPLPKTFGKVPIQTVVFYSFFASVIGYALSLYVLN